MAMPSHDDDRAKSCHLISLSLSRLSCLRTLCYHSHAWSLSRRACTVYTHMLLTNAWHACVRACVHMYVRACDVRRTGKWPRVIGASRSTVRWCVTRSESVWRNGIAYQQAWLVRSRGNRSTCRWSMPISADRRPRTCANFTFACKHRLVFVFVRVLYSYSRVCLNFSLSRDSFVLVYNRDASSSRCVIMKKERYYFANLCMLWKNEFSILYWANNFKQPLI